MGSMVGANEGGRGGWLNNRNGSTYPWQMKTGCCVIITCKREDGREIRLKMSIINTIP